MSPGSTQSATDPSPTAAETRDAPSGTPGPAALSSEIEWGFSDPSLPARFSGSAPDAIPSFCSGLSGVLQDHQRGTLEIHIRQEVTV